MRKDNTPVFIYAVICPVNSHVVYVGQTTDLEKRKTLHRVNKIYPFSIWYRDMLQNGYEPIFEVVEQTTYICRLGCEQKWIKYYKGTGNPLLNKEKRVFEQPVKAKHIHLHLDGHLFNELLEMSGQKHTLSNDFIQDLILKGIKHVK